MSNMFNNLSKEGAEEVEDRIGGFQPFESDIYLMTIMSAFGIVSKKGSRGMQIDADYKGKRYREIIYVTNKQGQNTYEKNGKKFLLPGFITIDDICMMITNKPLSEQLFEEKVANVYDPDTKKESPKNVPMAVDLIGQEIYLGIIKQIKNVQEERADGSYVNTAKERIENVINKVFHNPTMLTTSEAENAQKNNETPEAKFYEEWLKANKGQTRDLREIKDGQSAPQSGTQGKPGGAASSGSAPSLFAKK